MFILCFVILAGYGDWSSEGCMISEEYEENDTEVICHCTHLTSFTILLVHSSLLMSICIVNCFIHTILYEVLCYKSYGCQGLKIFSIQLGINTVPCTLQLYKNTMLNNAFSDCNIKILAGIKWGCVGEGKCSKSPENGTVLPQNNSVNIYNAGSVSCLI